MDRLRRHRLRRACAGVGPSVCSDGGVDPGGRRRCADLDRPRRVGRAQAAVRCARPEHACALHQQRVISCSVFLFLRRVLGPALCRALCGRLPLLNACVTSKRERKSKSKRERKRRVSGSGHMCRGFTPKSSIPCPAQISYHARDDVVARPRVWWRSCCASAWPWADAWPCGAERVGGVAARRAEPERGAPVGAAGHVARDVHARRLGRRPPQLGRQRARPLLPQRADARPPARHDRCAGRAGCAVEGAWRKRDEDEEGVGAATSLARNTNVGTNPGTFPNPGVLPQGARCCALTACAC